MYREVAAMREKDRELIELALEAARKGHLARAADILTSYMMGRITRARAIERLRKLAAKR